MVRRSKKSRSSSKRQKLWNMKGCAYHRTRKARCSKCNSMKGGCTTCSVGGGRRRKRMVGGEGLVGKPWTPAHWPGSNHVSGDFNHYKLNLYNMGDPQTQGVNSAHMRDHMLRGGATKSRRMRKGGSMAGLLPQDLVNLGRSAAYNIHGAYNGLNGLTQPVNPLPWMQAPANNYLGSLLI